MLIDRDTKQLDRSTLFGGAPARVLRLSDAGAEAWSQLQQRPVHTAAEAILARRLTDAAFAHPRPPALAGRPDVHVVIPVRDRASQLARCLSALGSNYPVTVVDDGSKNSEAIEAVCQTHAATMVRHGTNRGPAAARNTGLARASSEFIAFLDSDCVPPPGWIADLAAHLEDPLVAAVAARIVARPARSTAHRYVRARGGLDLGDRPALVRPLTRVSYVPTAALIVRAAALRDITADGCVFDPELRYGEDVDLVWRLTAAGWRVRYDPTVTVAHDEPDTWTGLITRRFRYGTSAGPLARRHPAAMPPLVLYPWPTITVAGLLARMPFIATAGLVGAILSTARSLNRAHLPIRGVIPATVRASQQTWLGTGTYLTRFGAPVLLAALAVRRPGRPRWGRRITATSLVFGPPITHWIRTRPDLDLVRYTADHLADDVAYGAGVWRGSLRARTSVPVRPRLVVRTTRLGEQARTGRPTTAATTIRSAP